MLSLFLATTVLLAGNPSDAKASPPAAKPAPSSSDMVCHKEPEIGSKVPKKVCRSRARMEADRVEQRELLERIQAGTPPPR